MPATYKSVSMKALLRMINLLAQHDNRQVCVNTTRSRLIPVTENTHASNHVQYQGIGVNFVSTVSDLNPKGEILESTY